MFDFNDPSIQVQMCKFQVDIKKARICIKFPCSYFVEWRTINNRYCVSTQNRVKATNQQAIFNQKITFYTQMIYNTKRSQYYSKQTFLILNLVSRSRPDQIKLVGRISIDLADILNRNRYRQMTHMKLNYCSVQSSLLFSINLIDKRQSNLSVKDLDKSAFTDYFSLNSVNRLIVDENIEKNYRLHQYNPVQNANRRGEMGANIQNMTRGYNSSLNYNPIDSYNNDMKKKNIISPLINKNDFDDKLPKFKNPTDKLDFQYRKTDGTLNYSSNQVNAVNMNGYRTSNDDDTMSFKFKNNNVYKQDENYRYQQLNNNAKNDPNNKVNRVGIAHVFNRQHQIQPVLNSNSVNNSDAHFFQKTKQGQDSLIQKLLIKQQKEININNNDQTKKLAQSDSVSKFSEVESQSLHNNQQLSSIVDRLQKQKIQQEQMIKSLRDIIKANLNKKKKQQTKQKVVHQKENSPQPQLQIQNQNLLLQKLKPTQNQELKFQINIRNQNAVYEQQERELLQNQKRIQQLQNQLKEKQNQLYQKQILLQEMKNRIRDLQAQNEKLMESKQRIQSQNMVQAQQFKLNQNQKNFINVNEELHSEQRQIIGQQNQKSNEIIISISKNPQIYQQQQKDIQELLQRVNELQSELKLYKQSQGNHSKREKRQNEQIKQNSFHNNNQNSQIKILITREPNIYDEQQNQILELTKTLQLQQEQLMNSVKRISMLQKQLDYKNSQKKSMFQQDQQEFKFSIKRDEQIYEQQQKDLTEMSNRIIELQEKLGYYSRLDKNKELELQKNEIKKYQTQIQQISQIQNPHIEQSQNYAIKVSKGQDIYQDQQRQIQELTKTVQQLTETIQKMDDQLNKYRQMANNSKTQKQINKKEDEETKIDCLKCSQTLQKIKSLQQQIMNLQEQKYFADSTQQLKSKIEELNNEIDLLKSELQISQKYRKQKNKQLQQLQQVQEVASNQLNSKSQLHLQQKFDKQQQILETQKLIEIENLRDQLDYLSKENINLKNSLVILQEQVQEQTQTIYILEQQVGRLSKEKEIFNEKEIQLKKNMEKKIQQVQKQYQNNMKINNLQNSQNSIKQKNQPNSKMIKNNNCLDKGTKLKQAVGQIQNLIEMRKPLSMTLITTISQKISELPSQQVKQMNLTDFQVLDCQVKKIKAQIMKIRDKPYSQKSKLISLFKPLQNSLLKIKQTGFSSKLNNFTKTKV